VKFSRWLSLHLLLLLILTGVSIAPGQSTSAPASTSQRHDEKLRFVAVLTRHGVRSPTSKGDQWNAYSSAPWPEWNVAPGYLTPHGAELMRLVGVYDHQWLAHQGLFSQEGCTDSAHVRILADSDQRTRETGKAWAEGFAPGCGLAVTAHDEGESDALFHPLEAGVGHPDKQRAKVEIAGRIGGKPESIATQYRTGLELLEKVLTGCQAPAACPASVSTAPRSLFDAPATFAEGHGDHMVDLRTPLSLAATMSENLLLEYAEGFSEQRLGWGRLDRATLNKLIDLHTANEDLTQRTSTIARAQASNLMFHVAKSMEQVIVRKAVAGSLVANDDKLLLLVGHDTNLANLAGALHLTWTLDGRTNDTPPGSALIFEVWEQAPETYVVRTYFTAQTLDQMRNTTPLSLDAPPERVAVKIPGCRNSSAGCPWNSFRGVIEGVIDMGFIR
jgi:4-phytase/acid phosphatase